MPAYSAHLPGGLAPAHVRKLNFRELLDLLTKSLRFFISIRRLNEPSLDGIPSYIPKPTSSFKYSATSSALPQYHRCLQSSVGDSGHWIRTDGEPGGENDLGDNAPSGN